MLVASRESYRKGRTAIRVGKNFEHAIMLAHGTYVNIQIDIDQQEVSKWRLWM